MDILNGVLHHAAPIVDTVQGSKEKLPDSFTALKQQLPVIDISANLVSLVRNALLGLCIGVTAASTGCSSPSSSDQKLAVKPPEVVKTVPEFIQKRRDATRNIIAIALLNKKLEAGESDLEINTPGQNYTVEIQTNTLDSAGLTLEQREQYRRYVIEQMIEHIKKDHSADKVVVTSIYEIKNCKHGRTVITYRVSPDRNF